MIKLERMKKGYEIGVRNLEESIKQGKRNIYIKDKEVELGGKEFIWDPWVRVGALFGCMSHPYLMYNYIINSNWED